MSPTSHIDALKLAGALRGYADGLTADPNEALFFIHSALLAKLSEPPLRVGPTDASLRLEMDRHAARASAARIAGDA